MTIGEFIKQYRTEHDKMSKRSFADLVGLSPQYVSNLERGFNNDGKPLSPTMNTYRKIAEGVGVSEKELLSMLNDNLKVNPPIENIVDIEIVSKYNALDAHGKQIVLALLDAEYERCTRNVIDLDDFTMVARSGKKMDEATKADAQKMAEIIFGDKE